MATTPAPAEDTSTALAYPESDTSFTFESTDSVPDYAKNWISWNNGPALAVPIGDILDSDKPYATRFANLGDEVKFLANKGSVAAHWEVIPGERPPQQMTKRVAQESAAPVEDLLKGGLLGIDDLSDDDKARLAAKPGLKAIIEGQITPEKQSISDRMVS